MIVIVYGPKGSGKTRNKEKLASVYEQTLIIDGVTRNSDHSKWFFDDHGKAYDTLPANALLLTCMTATECLRFLKFHERNATLVPISEALRSIE